MPDRKPYPKRNNQERIKDPVPKYEGRKLFRTGDTNIKCYECPRYASHEAEMQRFDPKTFTNGIMPTPFCPLHARKQVSNGVIVRIKPYPEFTKYKNTLAKWEGRQKPMPNQGTLV